MIFSKAVKKQLIAMDLVEAIIDSIRFANSENEQVEEIITGIKKHQWLIRNFLAEFNSQGGIIFDNTKQYINYASLLKKTKDKILSNWNEKTLDGREYINALLLYLEEIYWETGKTREMLEDLINEITRLYNLLDPELEDSPTIKGQQIGEELVTLFET